MNWWRFFRRAQADAEQRQELESYLEITTEEYIARGMNREEAYAAARKKLGNKTLVREEVYHMNTVAVFDSVWRDIRHALRSLRREPGFNLTATLTLALGIGATTVIFSIVNSVLLRPLGYPDADRLAALTHAGAGSQKEFGSAPFLHFTYIHEGRTFESSGLWQNLKVTVTGLAEPEEVSSLRVTSQVLPLLRVTPVIGRVFSDNDDSPGSPATTILAYGYWQRRFGGDPSAVGRTLAIDGQPHTIIGVTPSTFRFLDQKVDLIRPLQLNPSNTFLGYFAYRGIARLKPGVTLEQANADVNRMIPLAIEAFPPFRGGSREAFRANAYRADLHLLKESVVGDVGNTLWVLMGTIGLVLLIACVNCTNLFLVRTDVRHREFAVRAALGAGRFQIAGQLLTESIVLGLGACIVGVALAYGSLRLLVTLAPANLPRVEEIGIDGVTLAFALSVGFLCAVLVGLLPVLRSVGSSPASELHGGRTTNLTTGSHRLRSSLVVAQVAIALVLLIASGLMIRTFSALGQVPPGFISENVQTFRLTVPQIQVPQAENTARMMQGIMDRVAATPGVTNVAAASTVPLSGDWMTEEVRAENVDYSPGQPAPSRRVKFVSPGFFSALGTRIIAGRDFSWIDNYDLRQVAIVSETLAREEWRTPEAALGKRLQLTRNGSWKEVIAVVADVHDDALNQPSPPIAYFPILMDRYYVPGFVARTVTLVARTPRAGTESLLPEIQKAVWSVNPNLALADVRTMGNLFDASMARTSFALVMLAISGAMALVLGVVGIYGLLAYTVEQRRCEVGIRMALGAQPAMVRSMFVRRGLALSGMGIAVGLGGAAGLSRLMSSLLFGVEPLDPMTYAATAVSLMAAAVAASYIPALRAAAIDPVETLRGE